MASRLKQKEAILKVLRERTSHPTVEQVYQQVRKEIPNISLGTVYRNLKLLKQELQILKLSLVTLRKLVRSDNR